MKSKAQSPFIFLLFLALMALACGGLGAEPATPTAAPTNTPVPTNTPEPTATAVPDLTADFVPFNDEFQGLTLAHPPGWTATNFFFTVLASSEALSEMALSGETPQITEGAILLVIGGSTADLGSDDPETMINEAIAEFDIAEGEIEVISGPTVTRSNGQETVMLVAKTVAEGQEVVALYAIVVNEALGRTALLLGVTSPESEAEFVPLMQAVVSTVEIGEAAVVDDWDGIFGSDATTNINALPIFLNETWPDEVTADGPAYFSFSGAPNVSYDIVVNTLDEGLDLVLDLLDENGNSLLDGEVDETFSGAEAIRGFQPAEYGLFTVSVRGFGGGVGSFEISLMESK